MAPLQLFRVISILTKLISPSEPQSPTANSQITPACAVDNAITDACAGPGRFGNTCRRIPKTVQYIVGMKRCIRVYRDMQGLGSLGSPHNEGPCIGRSFGNSHVGTSVSVRLGDSLKNSNTKQQRSE